MHGTSPYRCERANYRATQHSLEILRPRISRSTPPRLSNETSQRTARVARKWARKLKRNPRQICTTRAKLHPRKSENEGFFVFWELSEVTVFGAEGLRGARKVKARDRKIALTH